MNREELAEYCKRLGYKKETHDLLEAALFSPPARTTQSGGGNVSGRYVSAKMECSEQTESRTIELPLAHFIEYDKKNIAYQDQPGTYAIRYQKRNGSNGIWKYTPDYLGLYIDEAGFFEAKPEAELVRLGKLHPGRYEKVGERWRSLAAEKHFAQYGLFFRIITDKDINWVLYRNIQFLQDYFRLPYPIPPESKSNIVAKCDENLGILLQDLLDQFPADHIYALIAYGHIYADINKEALVKTERVNVFSSKEKGEAFFAIISSDNTTPQVSGYKYDVGAEFNWDGKRWWVLNEGDEFIGLTNEDGKIANLKRSMIDQLVNQKVIVPVQLQFVSHEQEEAKRILEGASKEQLQEANDRFEKIRYLLDGVGPDKHAHIPDRTRRHWVKKFNEAQRLYGLGIIGLIAKPKGRKTGDAVIPEEDIEFAHEVIAQYYESNEGRTPYATYAMYKYLCKEQKRFCMSDQTFYTLIRNRDKYKQELARKGPKGAYPVKPFFDNWDETIPINGDFVWQYGHIDHTPGDIRFKDPMTGRVVEWKGTITCLLDAFSRRVLAIVVSSGAPSALSCQLVFRECVRRHGRVPGFLTHDGAVEFKGTYFQRTTAQLGISLLKRPPAQARFGSILERHLGTVTQELIHNLKGNTKLMKNPRAVDNSVNPEVLAIWSFKRFVEEVQFFCYEKYDTDEHSEIQQSPREKYENSLRQSGGRDHLHINYDKAFHIATLPDSPNNSGQAKVVREKGIKFWYVWYWNPIFREAQAIGKKLDVKYDPMDASIIWVHFNRNWHECRSRKLYPLFKNLSPEERNRETVILRERRSITQKKIKEDVLTDGAYYLDLEGMERQMEEEQSSKTSSIEHTGQQPSIQEVSPQLAEKYAGTNKVEDLYDDDY